MQPDPVAEAIEDTGQDLKGRDAELTDLIADRLADAHQDAGGAGLPAELVSGIVALLSPKSASAPMSRPPSWRPARPRTASPRRPGAAT